MDNFTYYLLHVTYYLQSVTHLWAEMKEDRIQYAISVEIFWNILNCTFNLQYILMYLNKC